MNGAPPGFIPDGHGSIINARSIDSVTERPMMRAANPKQSAKSIADFGVLKEATGATMVIVTVGKKEFWIGHCSLVQFSAKMQQALEEAKL